MAIALNDLGRDLCRFQPEAFTNLRLDRRIEMRVGPNRAAQFADPDPFPGLGEPFLSPAEFVEHQREFEAKGDRLRVDAVAAPNHRRRFVTAGPGRAKGSPRPQSFTPE